MSPNLIPIIIQGLLVGVALAAPIGPMAVLCVQRTLAGGFLFGFLTGLGIAAADGVYGLMAAFGLTAISDFLIGYRTILSILGGLFLIWLGIGAVRSSITTNQPSKSKTESPAKTFASAFLLTLTNPMTVLTFVAIFSGATIEINGTRPTVFAMTGAIVAGSLSWWIFLSGLVSTTKHKLQPKHMRWINVGSGLILLGFGIVAAGSAVWKIYAN